MDNKEESKFQIHYYFNDNSHRMNAFIRNKAEKEILEAIQQVAYILDINIQIDTEAYQEGGLKEILIISAITLNFFAPSLNDIITYYVTKEAESEKLDLQIKNETLKGLKLDNKKKEIELQKIFKDTKTLRHISNFYKKVDSYEKVKKIGYKEIGSDKEYIVEKKYFKNFILKNNKDIIYDEEATIEILSPVLKEGRYRWKGIYNNEKIDFSMGDYKFKKDVIEGKYTFANGSYIECKLRITIVYDDFGDILRKNYSVESVYGIKEMPIEKIKLTQIGKKKRMNERQGSLFDDIVYQKDTK